MAQWLRRASREMNVVAMIWSSWVRFPLESNVGCVVLVSKLLRCVIKQNKTRTHIMELFVQGLEDHEFQNQSHAHLRRISNTMMCNSTAYLVKFQLCKTHS